MSKIHGPKITLHNEALDIEKGEIVIAGSWLAPDRRARRRQLDPSITGASIRISNNSKAVMERRTMTTQSSGAGGADHYKPFTSTTDEA